MSNAKLWCFRCCWLELPIGQTVKLPVVWYTITLMWRPCDIIQLMSLHDVEWENTCTGHLFKRHMMECRQPQYAPITINSLCLTWSKVVSFFFLNSDAVRGWQQNYNQAWNHWELPQKRWHSCCECPRLNSAHVDKNTPEEYSKASMCCR